MANLQLTLEPGVPTGSPRLFDASDPDTQPIARLSWFANDGGWTREQQLEHGRRIVQCVNAHEELVANLREALDILDIAEVQSLRPRGVRPLVKRIKAIVAKGS